MFRFPSVSFLVLMLLMPFRYLYFTIKFFMHDVDSFPKYKDSLSKFLAVSIITVIYNGVHPDDLHFLTNYKASFMFKLFKLQHKLFVQKRLPGFGQPYDANSIWVTRSVSAGSDDPIIIYLHGGGYAYQLGPSQLEAVISSYTLLEPSKREKVSVLVLDYKLSSQGFTFPIQRDQLHETYQNLTVRDGHKNVTLMGDSAGGNLALVYLQYLKTLAPVQLIDSKGFDLEADSLVYPRNLVLVSPWVRVDVVPEQYVPGISYYDNRNRDIIQYGTFNKDDALRRTFGDCLIDTVEVSPLLRPFSLNDWIDIPTIKMNTLILAGEYETLRDDILEFTESVFGCPSHSGTNGAFDHADNMYRPSIHEFKAKTEYGDVGLELFIEPWGIHDAAFLVESAIAKVKTTNVDVNDLEEEEFFGLKKIVNFLDRVL